MSSYLIKTKELKKFQNVSGTAISSAAIENAQDLLNNN